MFIYFILMVIFPQCLLYREYNNALRTKKKTQFGKWK